MSDGLDDQTGLEYVGQIAGGQIIARVELVDGAWHCLAADGTLLQLVTR